LSKIVAIIHGCLLIGLLACGSAIAQSEDKYLPTYLECPTPSVPNLIFGVDSISGRTLQMKVTPEWLHFAWSEKNEAIYGHQVWIEVAKIDQLPEKGRSNMRHKLAQYEELLVKVCRTSDERSRRNYFDMLERNRTLAKPRWLDQGRPWSLNLTESMKADLPEGLPTGD
jgi:hypothetical protein